MKCSKCGRNFGNGMNCQYCGVDRVTGLANYGGYDNPRQGYESDNGGYVSSNTIVCYACGEVIPANSEFCPYCSTELYVKCPKCGQRYSSQYPSCNKCGTNRTAYYRQEEAKKQDAIRREEERLRRQREWERAENARKEKERKMDEEKSKQAGHAIQIWTLFWGVLWAVSMFSGIIKDQKTAFLLLFGAIGIYIVGLCIINWSFDQKS